MSTDKAREAFEHWYTKGNKECPSIQRTENRGKGELPYRLMQAQHAWGAWQAAWEALQPKAVDVEALKKDIDQLGVIKHCLEQRRCTQDHIDTLGEIYERFNSAFN